MKIIINSKEHKLNLKLPTLFLKRIYIKKILKDKQIEKEKQKIILSLLPKAYKMIKEYKKVNGNFNIIEFITNNQYIIVQI